MRALTKELLFRLMYSAAYFIALNGVYYFSYGWQCEYVSAQFRYHHQSLDYCYDESLLKLAPSSFAFVSKVAEAQAENQPSSNMPISKIHAFVTPIFPHGAQCWNDLFLSHSTYFYGIELHSSINSLLILFVWSYGLGWLLFCIHGWICEGQIHGRLTRQNMFTWATCHSVIISSYLALLSFNKELGIETLDSELIS